MKAAPNRDRFSHIGIRCRSPCLYRDMSAQIDLGFQAVVPDMPKTYAQEKKFDYYLGAWRRQRSITMENSVLQTARSSGNNITVSRRQGLPITLSHSHSFSSARSERLPHPLDNPSASRERHTKPFPADTLARPIVS
jgi:hypothetical protein